MCRLFPSALIEAIATGRPAGPYAIGVVARHICGDLDEAGGYRRDACTKVRGRARALARVAVNGTSVQVDAQAAPSPLMPFTE